MEIKAYKHEETGQIFESLKDFKKAQLQYTKKQQAILNKEKEDKAWSELINRPRLEATGILDFIARYVSLYNEHHKQFGLSLVNVELQKCSNVKIISNSHSCPINGVTNWGDTHKDRPKGYLGVTAQLVGEMVNEQNIKGYPSIYQFIRTIREDKRYDICSSVPGLNTGSGNGPAGRGRFNYGVRFFLDDFPHFKDKLEEVKKAEEELEPLKLQLSLLETQEKEILATKVKQDPLIDLYNTTITSIDQQYRDTLQELTNEKNKFLLDIANRKNILKEETRKEINFPEDLEKTVSNLIIKSNYNNII